MALTKEIVVDKIEVLEKGQVQVRTATRVLEDGVQLSSAFHRHVVMPQVRTGYEKDVSAGTWAATDVTGEDARVAAICTAAWTADVITAFRAYIVASDR
tara:strand:- start:83 stop:379 length:297 start_codon:yes stop_codon:yes gene_type:complete